jgi:dTDP-4-dehydrorhamnose 3,5-epimerase
MIFTETKLKGAYLIHPEKMEDERGFFARTFCSNEFKTNGLNPSFVQCNISFNALKGTIRGMHFQRAPHEEAKLVRCMKGEIFDVILDLRPESPTHGHWVSVNLSESNYRMLYIPAGCAHGFQTLKDNTEVFYQMSEFYHPESQAGINPNDPGLSIPWPIKEAIFSARDLAYPDFRTESDEPFPGKSLRERVL